MIYPPFIDNDTFYHLDQSKSDAEQLLALAENIKRIHLLSAKHHEDFQALIHDYLYSGIQIFQMQTGIVSNIVDNTRYIIKDVVSNLEVIHVGDEYPLEGTYCREVARTHQTIGFPHVGAIHELKDHPVYVNLKLESYLSAPIFVKGNLYGTLNFTSLNPRAYGFSEHEHDLISMMATSIGNFILLKQKEEKLTKINFRMKELIGHLSHDLRNPIGTINAMAKRLLSKKMDESRTKQFLEGIYKESARSLELVNTLLGVAALGTGKIVLHKEAFDASDFLKEILDSFSFLIEDQALNVVISVPAPLVLFADRARLSQVFYNLLSNAFKYAPKHSRVSVEFLSKEEHVTCRISNHINTSDPILDDALYKSIGYGLDIVDDILELHGMKRMIVKEGEHYSTSFDIELAK